MPGFNAVLRAWHMMLGRDLHIPWPPGSPAPAPAPVPYMTLAPMMGMIPMATSKMTINVFADSLSAMMVRGTDIGPLIPHVGPPSITLPIEMVTSGSKSHFGVTKWKVKDQTGAPGCVAVGVLGLTNLNLNCGTPAPTPFGLVIAPTTHLAALTLGDLISGLYMMAWDYMAQRIMYMLGNLAGDAVKKWWDASPRAWALVRSAGRRRGRWPVRWAYVPTSARPRGRCGRQRIAALAKVAERTTIALGLAAGSPLGISTSTTQIRRRGEVRLRSGCRRGRSAGARGRTGTGGRRLLRQPVSVRYGRPGRARAQRTRRGRSGRQRPAPPPTRATPARREGAPGDGAPTSMAPAAILARAAAPPT